MATRIRDSASRLLRSQVQHADVAMGLPAVLAALLLTDLAVALPVELAAAAMATRTPGSASKLLVATELLADLAVGPPEDLVSASKPLGPAVLRTDLAFKLLLTEIDAKLLEGLLRCVAVDEL
ncbi:hypothetical protein PF010_g30480 [Phytophthora fragariae]|uniref:Uncharacterized protein n=1 Tax=Phytophthora fragariae TaxID=53985 RepID=A0A6G0JKS2_9STRA|nr:hypothetical protein PF010_g30480 [Phytophthora fragariae]